MLQLMEFQVEDSQNDRKALNERGYEAMSRAFFFVVMVVFSLSQASICASEESTDFLRNLGQIFLGDEKDTGSLKVDSDPQGASIFVDNALKGKTPLSIDGIAPGVITVEVELEGYVAQDKELEIQPGRRVAVEFKLEQARSGAATAVTLGADPKGPSVKGTSVTFKAKGEGGTGWYEYRFFQKGPATDNKWVETQGYSPKDNWTWETTGKDVGENKILVHVRSAGSKQPKEAQKGMPYMINAVPSATAVTLGADPKGPSVKGTSVTFKAKGEGGTSWYEYRFFRKGPATDNKWVETQGYSPKDNWTWETTGKDVGENKILVHVRSAGSKQPKEAQKGMLYKIDPVKKLSPDRIALKKLLRELEEKIEDADRRGVAHPSFLDELRGLVKRYQ